MALTNQDDLPVFEDSNQAQGVVPGRIKANNWGMHRVFVSVRVKTLGRKVMRVLLRPVMINWQKLLQP